MLFPNQTEFPLENPQKTDIKKIPGICYIPEYIDEHKQTQLMTVIDQQKWSTKLKRRIQNYGYQYDHKKNSLASSKYLGGLPNWLSRLAHRLFDDRLTPNLPDQVIINEYQPGQGIASHIDCVPCFGKTISCLSLGSPCVMDFTHSQTKEKIPILLSPGSLLIFQGTARYVWEHGIAPRKKDTYQGVEFVRNRRVSITFREVLFPYK